MMLKEKILENRSILVWIIVFLILSISILYFFVKKPKNVHEELLAIPLKSGEMINWFVISNKYYMEYKIGDRYINLYVEYPEFMPSVPKDNFSMKKTIRILLDSYSEIEKDEIKTFLMHANGKECNLSVGCDTELVSKTEQYEIFEDTTPKNKSKYYYFEAYDGQYVLSEQHGISSNTFLMKRNIDGYLHVQYQYPVEIGNDFFKIDKEITEFIKHHLKFKNFKKG